MKNLTTDCDFLKLTPVNPITDFDCDDSDLNEFSFVFSSEQQEKDNLKKKIADDNVLHTRQMFFDMTRLEE